MFEKLTISLVSNIELKALFLMKISYRYRDFQILQNL